MTKQTKNLIKNMLESELDYKLHILANLAPSKSKRDKERVIGLIRILVQLNKALEELK